MTNTVIKVENLSKLYRLGVIGTGTLSHDLNRWWHRVRGKEDPYQGVGESNVREKAGDSDYVWALKGINFEVKQGEVLGIIGKNGAGKSTLLKILSKVTGPTEGRIMAKGRIASLLEVGTGFHPELTGRENIYLNGTILGMTRSEVTRKLEEIVEFAGVARYVDTPVKRYSSGMKVRLGFAVAAHLEPEILIVDEVLAVGDADFQKKAIGKMHEVSHEGGRTVLFVSHNMASVASLCDRAVLLVDGRINHMGEVDPIINRYLRKNTKTGVTNHGEWEVGQGPGRNGVYILNVVIRKVRGTLEDPILSTDSLQLECELWVEGINRRLDTTYQIKDQTGRLLFTISSGIVDNHELGRTKDPKNKVRTRCIIPGNFFNEGEFYVNLLIVEEANRTILKEHDIASFYINPKSVGLGEWMGRDKGALKPIFNWEKEVETWTNQ